MYQSVPGNGYNVTPFFDINYIQLLGVGKPILNNEELFLLSSLESRKPLCSLVYVPTLSWLVCLSPFSIYLQLFLFLFLFFYSCNIYPVLFKSFCICLKVWLCTIVVISLNAVMKVLPDIYTVLVTGFYKGNGMTNKIMRILLP